jgi:hypothetical protein
MLSLYKDNGLAAIPGASGLSDGGRHASNWYDVIEFGHFDAYNNMYMILALDAMSEMAGYLGIQDKYKEHATAARKAYQLFWNDDLGCYSDWIDVKNETHAHMYNDHNLLAIIHTVANENQTSRILENLDKRYKELQQEYEYFYFNNKNRFNTTLDQIHATPANMISVTPGDVVNDTQPFGFPSYENGGSFFHSTGLEIAARSIAGQQNKAYEVFERVMTKGYTKHKFWGALLNWKTGELSSEPLNNSLLILWGMLRGCFGVFPTLDGVHVVGKPAKQLNGARYEFSYMGRSVLIHIKDMNVEVSNL